MGRLAWSIRYLGLRQCSRCKRGSGCCMGKVCAYNETVRLLSHKPATPSRLTRVGVWVGEGCRSKWYQSVGPNDLVEVPVSVFCVYPVDENFECFQDLECSIQGIGAAEPKFAVCGILTYLLLNAVRCKSWPYIAIVGTVGVGSFGSNI